MVTAVLLAPVVVFGVRHAGTTCPPQSPWVDLNHRHAVGFQSHFPFYQLNYTTRMSTIGGLLASRAVACQHARGPEPTNTTDRSPNLWNTFHGGVREGRG